MTKNSNLKLWWKKKRKEDPFFAIDLAIAITLLILVFLLAISLSGIDSINLFIGIALIGLVFLGIEKIKIEMKVNQAKRKKIFGNNNLFSLSNIVGAGTIVIVILLMMMRLFEIRTEILGMDLIYITLIILAIGAISAILKRILD